MSASRWQDGGGYTGAGFTGAGFTGRMPAMPAWAAQPP